MSATHIDAALQKFVQVLAGTDGVGDRIYEDRSQVFEKSESPAINVKLVDCENSTLGDSGPVHSILRARAQVDLEIFTHITVADDGTELPPRQVAAPIWQSAHQRLMLDPTLGDLALRVRWLRSRWEKGQGDGVSGWAIHTYEITLAMRELTLGAPA